MTVTTEELKLRVTRGVKFLDERYGSTWPYDVNVGELDILFGTACILGQLNEDEDCYECILRKLGLDDTLPADDQKSSAYYGFDLTDADLTFQIKPARERYDAQREAWARLTDIWRNLVTVRSRRVETP